MMAWTNRRISRRTVRRLVQAWLATAGTMLLIFAGVAAQGAWRADGVAQSAAKPVVGRSIAQTAPAVPVVTMGQAMPDMSPGVTGTIDLPLPPPPSSWSPEPSEAGAAAPFGFGRASATDRGRALQCLTEAIYYEAESEPDAGQAAVAQVVLNRVRHPAFPHTVCGVVYQGSERSGCQFSFACDGATRRMPTRRGWARATAAAAMALAGRTFAPVGLATHYHTFAVAPAWSRTLVLTGTVGAHLFHRWKGWWGTAGAFSAGYAGGEPVPGPHPSEAAPIATVATIVTALPADAGIASRQGGRAAAAPAPVVADPNAGSGEVLDEWRDSGTIIQ